MMDMTVIDRDALERSMQIARRDPSCAEQLDSKLKDEPWDEVATFAAYSCQRSALRLKPWQSPPCIVDEDDQDDQDDRDEPDASAQKLLRDMLAAGISRFEPDPMAELKKKRRRVKK